MGKVSLVEDVKFSARRKADVEQQINRSLCDHAMLESLHIVIALTRQVKRLVSMIQL